MEHVGHCSDGHTYYFSDIFLKASAYKWQPKGSQSLHGDSSLHQQHPQHYTPHSGLHGGPAHTHDLHAIGIIPVEPNHLALRAHRPGHTLMSCARHTRTTAPDVAQSCHVAVSPSGTLLAEGAAASETVPPHRAGFSTCTGTASMMAPTAGWSNAWHARCIN